MTSNDAAPVALRLTVDVVRENAGAVGPGDGYLAAAIGEVGTTAMFRGALDRLYAAFDDLCVDVYNRAVELAEDDD